MTPTKKQKSAALKSLNACLEDDEDGHGYLWDMMHKHGDTIRACLQPIEHEIITGAKQALEDITGGAL